MRMTPPTQPTPRAPLGDPRASSGIAQLMVVLDATIVNIALPSRAAGARLLRRRPPVDRHRLRAGLRQPAAARRPHRRPLRPQAHLHRRPARLRRRLGASAAPRRASACSSRARALQGVVRRAARPGRAVAADDDVHRPGASAARRSASSARSPAPARAIGLLLGGILTEYLSWRWCLYVNLAVRDPGRVRRAARCCTTSARPAAPRLDIPGTLTASLGLFALVYGFSQRRDRRLERAADARLPRRRRRAAGRLRADPAPRRRTRCCRCASCSTATAAAPTWPIGIAGVGHVRRLPVPDLLPAADPRLLADPDRPGVPADDRSAIMVTATTRDDQARCRAFGPRRLIDAGMALAAARRCCSSPELDVDSTYAGARPARR